MRMLNLVAVSFLVLAPSLGLADEMGGQAQRQLDLARSDLEAGNPERALNAAQSALRLDPRLYEAMVLKALAYEKLGDTERAKALLVAYVELTSGITPSAEALEALERMTSKKERRRAAKNEKKQAKAEEKGRKRAATTAKKEAKTLEKSDKKAEKKRKKAQRKADKVQRKADKAQEKADKAQKESER